LRTREGSTIRLLLTNGTLITLSPKSEGKILTYFQEPITASNRTFQETTTELSPSMVKFELSLGELIVETKKLTKSSSFDIHSPLGVAGIRGTAFRLRVDDSKQTLDVIRGQVDCQQGKGRVTSVIGGQANTATRGRISDPEDIAADAGQQIEQACASLGKEVGGRTVAELSQAHEKANPPLEISIQADGFEAELRRMIRRPRGQILQEDYDRVGSIHASSKNEDTANLKDLRFVQKLRNLTRINLTEQPISDLKPLVYCKNLNFLRFHGSMGSDFSVLSDLKKLEHVTLHAVGGIKFPHKLPPKLNSISFTGESYMKSWDFLKNLDELGSLKVSPTADFTSITKLKTLKRLVVEILPEVKEMPEPSIFQSFRHLETLTFQFRGVEKTLTDDDLNKLKAMLPEVEIKVTQE
jgi:Leucine-rich repeat (LRR) protein